MIALSQIKIPQIFRGAGIKPEEVTVGDPISTLHGEGLEFNTYSFPTTVGTIVEFPDEGNMYFGSRPTRAGRNTRMHLMLIGVNEKPQWLNVSQLRRRNDKNEGVDALRQELAALEDDEARVTAVAGRKFKVVSTVQVHDRVFDSDNNRYARNSDGSYVLDMSHHRNIAILEEVKAK